MKTFSHKIIIFNAFVILTGSLGSTYARNEWPDGLPDECTSVTAGRLATSDGSVITSHTDDSHRTHSWIDIRQAQKHSPGASVVTYKQVDCDTLAMPAYSNIPIGTIPQSPVTYGFINNAYPCMNQFQVGIGESTFGGREELQSDEGLIDCQRLCQLMLER